jgi:hypothetical protein
MWLHELGHAMAAWLCGRVALPGPWITWISDERSWVVTAVLWGVAFFLFRRAGERRQTALAWFAGGLALAALVARSLSDDRAQALISFAGDAGSLILGTLLMLSFYAGERSRLRRGGLRFGLLAIGALAFADTFSVWWAARRDSESIPFGEIEGVGLSDASRLVDQLDWTVPQLLHRYLFVCLACLLWLLFRMAAEFWRCRQSAG